MDELTIGDKIYISSKQAAKITGYAKDYVGQLCREGRVEARLVGRNWYVLESSIREHRFGGETKAVDIAPEPLEEGKPSPTTAWEAPKYAPVEEEALMPPLEPQNRPQAAPQTAEAVALMQDAWKEWFETREHHVAAPQTAVEEDVNEIPVEEEDTIEEPEEEVRVSDIPSIYAVDEVSQPEEEERVPLSRIRTEEAEEAYMPEQDPTVRAVRSAPRTQGSVVDLTQARIIHEEIRAPERAVVAKGARRPTKGAGHARSGLVLQASLLAVAGLTAAIAVVGSGVLDQTQAAQGLSGSLRGAIFEALRGETRVNK